MCVRVQNGMSLVTTFPQLGWCQAREFVAKIARFAPNSKENIIFWSRFANEKAINENDVSHLSNESVLP